jgi:hypothetical protein
MEVVMRQHLFRGKGGRWEIRVGWTDALESFFAVVWDVNDEDDSPVFTAGSLSEEIDTVEKLALILEPYGLIPDDKVEMLKEDQARGEPPIPLRRLIGRKA